MQVCTWSCVLKIVQLAKSRQSVYRGCQLQAGIITDQKNGGSWVSQTINFHRLFHFMDWFVICEVCDVAGAGHLQKSHPCHRETQKWVTQVVLLQPLAPTSTMASVPSRLS